jgi:hypothetical protein
MIENYTLFFTATIINWNKLLNPMPVSGVFSPETQLKIQYYLPVSGVFSPETQLKIQYYD